jgi:hypothetical protein
MFDNLSRKELQQLCKDANLKANGKNSDLIARLLENNQSEMQNAPSSAYNPTTNTIITNNIDRESVLCPSDSQITLLGDSIKVDTQDVKIAL